MASNDETLLDGDGNSSDWVELYNPTPAAIDLTGWHLTDDATNLDKWTFPSLPQSVLDPGEYLVVFASGQLIETYVDPGGNLHTDFRLSAGGEYLALTDPAQAIVQEYAPLYPPQQTDVSYGIYPDDLAAGAVYFATPTPGAENSIAAVSDAVVFSHTSQTFSDSFQLTLTGTTNGDQTIVYTTDGTVPDESSTAYSGSITISSTTQIRARIIEAGLADGPVTSGNYSRLGADLLAFESQLPILLIENFGAGQVPSKDWNQTGAGVQQVARQSSAVTVFDNSGGTSSLTGAVEMHSRGGIRTRGAFSTTFPEPQYSLETWDEDDNDVDVDVFGMAPEADWILYAPHTGFDQTLMNNQFMFGLAYPTTVWAPEVQFVEAFLNTDGGDVTMDDYVGLYVWTEKVERDPGRLDFERFAEDGTSGGWLLSINRMDPLPAGEPGATPQHFHTPGPNGILQTPPNAFGNGDDIPRQGNAFINFEHPNGYDLNATQRQAIEDWFADMEDVLYGRTAVPWDDPVDGYARYIDVDNFIDYYILHNLSRNGDGLLLSMWIYNPDPNNGGKLMFGPPWDHDLGSFEGNPNSDLLYRANRLWYDRLFEDPAFVERYEARWHIWRQSILSDNGMNQVFDNFVAEIGSEAFERDGVTNITSRIDTVKNWLSDRAAAIDEANGGAMTVAFTVDQTTGTPPLTVQFTDQSELEGITGWLWDFGDNQTSTEQNPSHTYTAAGFYDVTLTITASLGDLSITKSSFIAAMTPGDVDMNGTLEMADITQFIANWRADTFGLSDAEKTMRGDLNRDGVTNFSDWFMLRQAWQDAFGASLNLGDLIATVHGDYNGDGSTDYADRAVWRSSFGQVATGIAPLAADGNFDGVVDIADYTVWRDHLFAVTTVVDAPASLVLAAPTPPPTDGVESFSPSWPLPLQLGRSSVGAMADRAFASIGSDSPAGTPPVALDEFVVQRSTNRSVAVDAALAQFADESDREQVKGDDGDKLPVSASSDPLVSRLPALRVRAQRK